MISLITAPLFTSPKEKESSLPEMLRALAEPVRGVKDLERAIAGAVELLLVSGFDQEKIVRCWRVMLHSKPEKARWFKSDVLSGQFQGSPSLLAAKEEQRCTECGYHLPHHAIDCPVWFKRGIDDAPDVRAQVEAENAAFRKKMNMHPMEAVSQ